MQKKIALSFNSSWVLGKRDDDKLPVEALVASVKGALDAEVLHTSLTDCEIVIKAEQTTEADIASRLVALIKEVFSIDDLSNVVDYTISDYVAVAPSETKKTEDASETEPPKAAESVDKTTEILREINALVGAEEFKALADECVKIAPGLRRHHTVEAFTHQCYIFAINSGNGLTTYLNLFANLLSELKLFEFTERNRVVEETLLPPQAKDSDNSAFLSVYSHFQSYGTHAGKIILIDISEWMTKIADKRFRDFLSTVDDHLGEHIFVFTVPFVEKKILNGLCKGLGDILFIRDVSFVPFNHFELTKCAEKSLAGFGFTMEEDAWDVFRSRITEEKNDGRFYGINTVNKVIREMIYRKQLNNALAGIDDAVIKKSEILDIAVSYGENEKTGFELLDDFVGMESIRKRVEEIVAQIELSSKNSSIGSPCIHMRFVGNPGTGKTTVARVIGKILK